MNNPIAFNPVGMYQQLLFQAQQQIPSLLPRVDSLTASKASGTVDEREVNRDHTQELDLHTLVDYTPWLMHLYQHWLRHIQAKLGIKLSTALPTPSLWTPETTAKSCHDVMLTMMGKLWHQQQLPLPTIIERLTDEWRLSWQSFWQEVCEAQTSIGIQQALVQTVVYFHRYWLESCLHLAQMHATLPATNAELSVAQAIE